MEFKIECPWCKQHYSVDESFIGQNVECTVCGKEFTVGAPNVSAPASETNPTDSPSKHQEYTPESKPFSFPKNDQANPWGAPQVTPYSQTEYMPQPPQYPQPPAQYCYPMQQPFFAPPVGESDKSRNTYALLGFFLGFLGIHSFYIGKVGNGIATILCNVLCTPPVVIFFVGIELLTVTADSQNLPLRDKNSPVALILGTLMVLGGVAWFFLGIFFLAKD